MLAIECSKCSTSQKYKCKKQFINATKKDKIFCPLDGSVYTVTRMW